MNGHRANGPNVLERYKDKLFAEQRGPPPKKRRPLSEMVENATKIEQPSVMSHTLDAYVWFSQQVSIRGPPVDF